MTIGGVLQFAMLASGLICLCGCAREDVYAPVKSFRTQGQALHAYLKLDDNGAPSYLEVRKENHLKTKTAKSILFRAYGAETLKMKLEMEGVRFSLFADTAATEPDTMFVIDVIQDVPYFECRVSRK